LKIYTPPKKIPATPLLLTTITDGLLVFKAALLIYTGRVAYSVYDACRHDWCWVRVSTLDSPAIIYGSLAFLLIPVICRVL